MRFVQLTASLALRDRRHDAVEPAPSRQRVPKVHLNPRKRLRRG
jgi:hypothetical protein